MLRKTKKGLTLWVGTGMAIVAMTLAGCGGSGSKTSSRATAGATAATTSATTGGATSGTIGTIGSGGGVGPGPGGSGPIVINPGGGGTNPGGGGTNPGGGGTNPGGGGGVVPPPGVTDDHGNDWNTATAVTRGTPLAGATEYAADPDWFSVDLSAGVDYSFITVNLGAGMDPIVRVYDTDGTTLIDENDDFVAGQPESRVDYTVPADGTYYAEVVHSDATADTGYFELNVVLTAILPPPPRPDDHGNDMASATAHVIGTPLSGEIENAGDEDWFEVDLTAGQAIEVRVTNLQQNMDSFVTLYDSTGSFVDDNDDYPGLGLGSGIDYTAPADDTYYVAVNHLNSGADTGTYDMVVQLAGAAPPPVNDDHGNDSATATAIDLANPASPGRIETGGDDWFSLDMQAFTDYELRVNVQGMDSYLYLIDTDGTTVLAQNDDFSGQGLGSGIDFRPTANGTYFFYVRHYSANNGTGDYDVTTYLAGGGLPPVPSAAPSLTGVDHADVDGSNNASAGDTLTLNFSEDIAIAANADLDTEVELLVLGDTFGAGATIAASNTASQVVITLGTAPVLRLSGRFDPATVTQGASSGLQITSTTTIASAITASLMAAPSMADVDSPLQPGFFPTAALNTGRGMHSATLLNDGRVLVVGGLTDLQTYATEAEMFDGVNWTNVSDVTLGGNPGGYMAALDGNGASFATGRFDHTATLLSSGQVLISGGRGFDTVDAAGAPQVRELASSFLFDPTTNTFAATGNMNVARFGHYAVELANGQVMIHGGFNSIMGTSLDSAELFDPTTGVWTSVAGNSIRARQGGSAHLVGGKVLLIGGESYSSTAGIPPYALSMPSGSEGFDVALGAWSQDADLNTNRRWHASAQVANGDVIVFGGDTGSFTTTTIELYEAATGTFSRAGRLATSRSRAQAALLGGDVLVVGGVLVSSGPVTRVTYVGSAELYNVANQVTESYQMQAERNSHRVVSMPNGSVLVVGGWQAGVGTPNGIDGTPVMECESFLLP